MAETGKHRDSFIRLFLRHFKTMALGTVAGLAAMAASVGLLALAGWFISAAAFAGLAVVNAHLFNFFYPAIGVRLFAIIRTVARYGERVFSHDATFRILESLRTWFYRNLEPLAPGRLMRYRSADLLNRIVADIEALDNLYLRVLSPSIIAALLSAGVLIFLWGFAPFIALTTFLALVVAGVVVPAFTAALGAAAGCRLARRNAQLRTEIVESLQGMAELLVFGAHGRRLDIIGQTQRSLIKDQQYMSHLRGASSALLTLVSGGAVLIVTYIGAGLVSRCALEGPDLALVALAVMASFEAVWALPGAYQYLGHTREAGRRLRQIVDAKPTVEFPAQSVVPPAQFDLRFDQVTFRYHRNVPPALAGVDFYVPPAGRVAVVGQTGAGKTSLINLLVRFWDPQQGRILMGGQDICRLSETDLRRRISVVSQQAHMFAASLRGNLLLARPQATEDELVAALERVQLLDFVRNLPDGLDTWIGEFGQRLSAGQARRLAVARAVLHDAPIWVLDEPTEGLDRITAQQLMTALDELTAGRTLLLITHRMVGLERMDRIVLLEAGRIAGQGSHQELLKKNSRYAALQMSCRNI